MSSESIGRRVSRRAGGVCGLSARLGMVTTGVGLCLLVALPIAEVMAKTPGAQYCFRGICHRVKTIAETRARIGKTETVQASYYDDAARDRFNPSNLTSSGELFRASLADNAASPIYPDGTKLLVWHPATKQAAVVRINNAGPYFGRRLIDLSRAAAEKLGFVRRGVATVQVRVIEAPTPAEATYRHGRVYAPVLGFLGNYPDLEVAYAAASRSIGGGGDVARVAVAALTALPQALVVEPGELMPPPEMGEFTIAETAPALVLPALTLAALAPDVVAQALAPVPMQVALRVATAAPAQAPAPAASKGRPTRVAAERQAGPWTVSKSAQPQRKQASARLAAAVIATAKPILAGRGEAKLASRGGRDSRPSVDQSGKASFQVASRHVATMAEASEEEEVDLKWVPKVLDGAN